MSVEEYRQRAAARAAKEAELIRQVSEEWEAWVEAGGTVQKREILNHVFPKDAP